MTSVRDDEYFGDNAHKEHCNASLNNLSLEPHAREKVARVSACEVSVLFTVCSHFRIEVSSKQHACV